MLVIDVIGLLGAPWVDRVRGRGKKAVTFSHSLGGPAVTISFRVNAGEDR